MKKIMIQSHINYILLISIVLIATMVRYYQLNNGFGINMPIKTETYSVNQVVNVGNNVFCGEKGYDCINAKVINSSINNIDYYDNVINLENVSNKEEFKVLTVDLELNNTGSKTLNINYSFFRVLGCDWCTITDEELTYAINNTDSQSADGIIALKPNKTEIIKLAFVLSSDMFNKTRFQRLYEEDIRFSLTSFPISRQIVI